VHPLPERVPGAPRPMSARSFGALDARVRTLADASADRIRHWIAQGELAVGERLPPERVLVAELGVSRTVLREALSSLEALGIIEARSTRGRFVASGGSSSRSRMLVGAWLHQHAEQMAEIDEIRSVLEAQAVRSLSEWEAFDAARRARALLLDQEAAIERGDPVQAAECDLDFHRLLCSYTHNGTLRSLAEGLIETSRQATLAVYSLPEASRRSLEQHHRIVHALAAGNPEAAARLAREHMVDAARRYAAGAVNEQAEEGAGG
jgi:GntR family transcriptional repressor for pyruvate dehydrogenase complex